RSLNIDFLLGYLKTLLPRRPDLKVIITSATIDPQSFAEHFADQHGVPAPIIEVSGRTYPVELRYRPLTVDADVPSDDPQSGRPNAAQRPANARTHPVERDLFEGVVDAVGELGREAPGDVLAFFSGEAEIRDAADALRALNTRLQPAQQFDILPLYGRLSAAEQHRVFERPTSSRRRVVLATNVAETSLTVPGIRYVIDAGTARISRYSSRSKVQRLPIEAISQASANQRSGRSGRTSPGIAIRLYSEDDFEARPAFTEPEILRTGLASVILQMLSLGLGAIEEFPFLTPPDRRDIRDGLALLEELGAVRTARGSAPRVTRIGRELSRLPIEPRFARMVVEAKSHGVVPQVIALAAGLTVQDVRERPAEQRGRADEMHARFSDPLGDLMTLLNLWNYLREQQRSLSSSAFRRLCKAEFLNYLRVREWMDLDRQISRIASVRRAEAHSTDGGLAEGGSAEAVHRSVLAGLLSHLGVRDDLQDRRAAGGRTGRSARKPAQEYLGSRGHRFALHPSSVLAKQPPEVVMSVELVETSRLFARNNAAIDPAWAETLAGPLAKRQISEPRWEKSQGAAVAYERVTLYGVPLVANRRVQLSRFDVPLARELFIRHALVDGEWDSPQAFDRANQQLRRELRQLEDRSRQRGLFGDDDTVFAFYDARVPADVTNVRDFEGWWKRAQRETPKLLTLRREDLLVDEQSPGVDEQEFPREWRHGDQTLKLRYRFEPGAEDDGVTVNVPLPLLPRMSAADFERLVPGLREELVTALIRSLPKAIRKHVVPAADWARTLLAEIEPLLSQPGASLRELLAAQIQRKASLKVSAEDFDVSKLPPHLTPTYRVVDGRGRTVGTGKNLSSLQQTHREQATKGVARVAQAALPKHSLEQTGLTSWSFGDLPRHVDSTYAGGRAGAGTVRAYPALVDRRASVDLVLVADEHEQARLTRRGVRRLLALSSPSPASYVREHLSNDEKLLLSAGPYRTLDDAIADVALAVADDMIRRVAADGLVWRQDTFETIANDYARALIDEIYRGIALTARVLNEARLARKAIDAAKSLQVLGQVTDASTQMNGLIWATPSGEGFVSRGGLTRLARVPIYLQAIRLRMQALTAEPGRDRAWQNESDRAYALFTEAGGKIPLPADAPESLVRTRWLLEEFRVSLFAQSLKTAEPVSLQRIRKALSGH
ncbi:MAG: ATP-dependent RNA helicase HrpA, partial [Microbacteriaceae bacterium]|nr:ATP-dependent RNA helicase HrpA [Microbacteriaceae bacterium]